MLCTLFPYHHWFFLGVEWIKWRPYQFILQYLRLTYFLIDTSDVSDFYDINFITVSVRIELRLLLWRKREQCRVGIARTFQTINLVSTVFRHVILKVYLPVEVVQFWSIRITVLAVQKFKTALQTKAGFLERTILSLHFCCCHGWRKSTCRRSSKNRVRTATDRCWWRRPWSEQQFNFPTPTSPHFSFSSQKKMKKHCVHYSVSTVSMTTFCHRFRPFPLFHTTSVPQLRSGLT